MRGGRRNPPPGLRGGLRYLGPGLIVAGSIVGSGELVATTKVGAEAGFWLLWLILAGCVIKVFTQIEFGRMAITEGQTTLAALDTLPGPRLRVNWVLWYWLIMTVVGLAQLGGIVGGVGQALHASAPLTESGREWNALQDESVNAHVALHLAVRDGADAAELTSLKGRVESAGQATRDRDAPADPALWAALLAFPTAVLLMIGRYRMIQLVATSLVAVFTAVTLVTLIMLQLEPEWAVSSGEVTRGLSFDLPPPRAGLHPLATALAAFGIIGVGAAELVFYPYWCLEKGYARWTGEQDGSDGWVTRARGWLRVMRWDVFLSMVVYTVATVAFYLLGAAVLGRTGLVPENENLVRTLAAMYEPVFGTHAREVFLFGAFAVLYSTYFVASASYARVCADAICVFGVGARTAASRRFWERLFSGAFPIAAFVVFAFVRAPTALILAAGISQALMLPVLGFGALWFRYRRVDARLAPGRIWDLLLWLSGIGLFLAGGWTALVKLGII